MKRNVIVLDLDGTLFNIGHRVHHLQAKDYETANSLLIHDEVHEDVVNFLSMLDDVEDKEVIAVTGRDEKWRELTHQKLDSHRLGYYIDMLLMRPYGNFASDGVMKLQVLEKHFGSKEEVLKRVAFCLDDRDKVVEEFRNYGLPCWQVRQGAY
jgi:hypothetical protein